MYQKSVFLFYQMIKKNLKNENVTTTFKRRIKLLLKIIDPQAIYQQSLRYLNE